MSEVGDAVELTFSTAPNATVVMSWINRDTETVLLNQVPVAEKLDDQGAPTGLYPVTLVGDSEGMWEARFVSSGTATSVESYFERFELSNQTPPLASLAEYEELYGTLSAARQATARALLRRASKLIRDTFPNVGERIAAGTVSRDTVGLVVINMVVQVMRNPAGLRSETTGPFARSYDPEAASGMLMLTEEDLEMLATAGLGTKKGKRAKVGTARIGGNMVPPVRSREGRRWPRGSLPTGW